MRPGRAGGVIGLDLPIDAGLIGRPVYADRRSIFEFRRHHVYFAATIFRRAWSPMLVWIDFTPH